MTYLSQWSARDRGLAEGLILHESQQHVCGHQWDRATHPEMDGEYEVETVTCHACAALDRWRAEQKGTPEPGVLPIVRDFRPASKGPLPPRPAD